MSNPAQNPAPCPVIVKSSEIDSISAEKTGRGEIDGTVSSYSPSAAGFRTGIPRKVVGDIHTAGQGSSITTDVPVLRADHPKSEASLSGVWQVAQRRFP